jgi:hypothetical protein
VVTARLSLHPHPLYILLLRPLILSSQKKLGFYNTGMHARFCGLDVQALHIGVTQEALTNLEPYIWIL